MSKGLEQQAADRIVFVRAVVGTKISIEIFDWRMRAHRKTPIAVLFDRTDLVDIEFVFDLADDLF